MHCAYFEYNFDSISPGSATTPVFPSAPLSLETTENFSTEHILGVVCNKVLAKAQVSGPIQSLTEIRDLVICYQTSVPTLVCGGDFFKNNSCYLHWLCSISI